MNRLLRDWEEIVRWGEEDLTEWEEKHYKKIMILLFSIVVLLIATAIILTVIHGS